jgi:predicted transcriptional regulator
MMVATVATEKGLGMGSSTTTGVKLDEATRDRLKRLGELKKRTPHWIMREAILTYLDREERKELERQEDQERWQRFQATGHHVPHEAIKAWLETWGTDKEDECPQPGD